MRRSERLRRDGEARQLSNAGYKQCQWSERGKRKSGWTTGGPEGRRDRDDTKIFTMIFTRTIAFLQKNNTFAYRTALSSAGDIEKNQREKNAPILLLKQLLEQQ